MNYGGFLKIIRDYGRNQNMSNEDLVNSPINCLLSKGKVRKQKGQAAGELFFYESTRACRIVNNKEDISQQIRRAASRKLVIAEVETKYKDFVDDFFDENYIGEMVAKLCEVINLDPGFTEKERESLLACSDNPSIFLARIMLHSLKENNKTAQDDGIIVWSSGDRYVKVKKGDILTYAFGQRMKKQRIVVIPVDTAFNLHVTTVLEKESKPCVSIDSLHGQFIIRAKKGGTSEIDMELRIRGRLVKDGLIDGTDSSINTSIGTIVPLSFNSATIYLLAVSVFDKNNMAISSRNDIKTSIMKMLQYYNSSGQGYDLYVPLVGTGLSRSGLDQQAALDLLLDTFVGNTSFIHGKIHIIVKPTIFDSLKIPKEET